MSCHLLGFQTVKNFKLTETFEDGKTRITFHEDSEKVDTYITIQKRLNSGLVINTQFLVEEI